MTAEPNWNDPERSYYERRNRPPLRNRYLGQALLLIFGIALAAIILEGVARFAERVQPKAKGGYSPVRGRRAHEPKNSAGYRDIEHTKEKPFGVHRAVFVGDSFTYGAGVLFDDTYAKRTERALHLDRSETWESIVLAEPGLDTQQEAKIIEKEAFAYSPDLVVLGYVLNDAEDPGAAERRRATDWTARESEGRASRWWEGSALFRLVSTRLRATRENRERIENHLALYREDAPGFRAVKRSIEIIAAQCREKGVPFVVVLFPLFANPLDQTYPFASIHEKMNAALPEGVIPVDLLPFYRGMDWRLLVVEGERDEHPNELAHRIAAQALTAAVESLLDSKPPSLVVR